MHAWVLILRMIHAVVEAEVPQTRWSWSLSKGTRVQNQGKVIMAFFLDGKDNKVRGESEEMRVFL